ncbi:MAG: primosomal protein N', partial [Bacteroidia bacterium]|nr:primosomal protein N' [Bacteroidia bacterium]
MIKEPLYTDIILPLPLPKLYTYSVPEELYDNACSGKRTVVQFGKKKIYTGLIKNIHKNRPKEYETKDILTILDDTPIVNEIQLKFWQWISEYYLCSIGEVMKAALPSGLKLESETKVIFNPEFKHSTELSPKEELIYTALENRKLLTIKEINDILEQKNSLPVIKSLLNKQAIYVEERLIEKYRPKYTTYIQLHNKYKNQEELHQIFDKLAKAPKQLELLMNYINYSKYLTLQEPLKVSKDQLLETYPAGHQALPALVKKNIFVLDEVETGRIETSTDEIHKINELAGFQEDALNQIYKQFETKDVILLHGITSSGKTEIYIHLIKEYLEMGKQVLYLLPEIALTAQIINRLKKVFGNKAGIYHSRFSDSQRVETWNAVLNKNSVINYQLILGARSSLFLPYDNLGLVIVDEEHENTYKQYDPSPRYHARDAAIMLARLHNAKTLLGTATPSIESYYNAQNAKYGLVELKQRYKEIKLPEIFLADTREAYRKKKMLSHFSPLLLEKIEQALSKKEQIILFQNRRGFSPYVECNMCNWIPKCEHCDVSLTYHKYLNQLVCHYCGYTCPVLVACKACGSTNLQTRGFGTEKVEDEIAIFFPNARIARLDLDTTRSRKIYEKILNDFENRAIDILVGTQMITKGLDFDNVSIVGIMNADNMLNFPDFRAFERSFQLMAQVSGRAGRKHKQGEVIIQTGNPNHPVIQDVISNHYAHLYLTQLTERKQFNYPPFYRLIEIILKHKKTVRLNPAAHQLTIELKK